VGVVSSTTESSVMEFIASFSDETRRSDWRTYFAEDAIYTDGSRASYEGAEAIAAEMTSQFSVIANTTVEIIATAFQGGTGFVERIERHEIGGKPLAVEVVGAFEVDAEGRIKRWRDYYDLRAVSTQMKAAGITVPPR
jgi:limonene-1,2-epoxide hydrolase